MQRKKASSRSALASDDTFEVEPRSDEARLPRKGALKPPRPRNGTPEESDLHLVAQRAAESTEDSETPLDFEPPARDARDDEPDHSRD